MNKPRVLITGGAAGIGAAAAERCRADGYEAVIIERSGDGIRADLSHPDETAQALQAALAGGPITRLLNNVGVVCPADAADQTASVLRSRLTLRSSAPPRCRSINGRSASTGATAA